MSGLRWVAAVMVVLGAGVASPPPAGAAGAGELRSPPVLVTSLVTADGTALQHALKINERGEILGHVPSGEPDQLRPAIWRRGAVTRIAPEGVVAYAADLSERGEVVGFERGSRFLETFAFSWSRRGWSRLPTGMLAGWALDANDRGQVLGAQAESRDGPTEPLVWDRGAPVMPPPEAPLAGGPRLTGTGYELINNRGQAVVARPIDGPCGPSSPCTTRAAIWQVGGEVLDLGTLGGATSTATDINERGDAAGTSETANGETHAFLWRDGEMIDLGTLGGARSEPVALNDRGDVVGTSQTASGETHAFLWRDGQMTALASLGGRSSSAVSMPSDINNWGQVVGTSVTPEGRQHAVLWHGGRTTDLGALVEGDDSIAADINDRGQIVGSAYHGELNRSSLWTTFPFWEPA